MKHVLIFSLLAVCLCSAQTPESEAHKLGTSIAGVQRMIDLRNQEDAEFMASYMELAKLHNSKVNEIILAHLKKINALNNEINKL